MEEAEPSTAITSIVSRLAPAPSSTGWSVKAKEKYYQKLLMPDEDPSNMLEDEDLEISLVRYAMSRNRYLELKSAFHVQDNFEAQNNKKDKSFKIRPLLDLVSRDFQKWVVFHEYLSIDEMIARYYGQHSLKQFILSNPIRFGYKLWATCGNDGYCYKFSLYCGKETGDNQPIDPLGTRVINNMLSVVTKPNSHQIFFDNSVTNVKLLVNLRKKGYRATGTLRNNRILNAPLLSVKEIEKRNRGSPIMYLMKKISTFSDGMPTSVSLWPQIMILLNRWFQFKDETKKKKP
ncbi:hypothetical protein ILUMI_21890 [Ignelater luminosus]|uniref:PiggyBac transposable element-derived protein domain-containing protein n=1 Tax=Ignelater luminosus TaxID=2038154 RepID=A0A8K0CGW2_IGNLU|nr:hypothetical protein ILUMI_21890 [Ignelater luminosus]